MLALGLRRHYSNRQSQVIKLTDPISNSVSKEISDVLTSSFLFVARYSNLGIKEKWMVHTIALLGFLGLIT